MYKEGNGSSPSSCQYRKKAKFQIGTWNVKRKKKENCLIVLKTEIISQHDCATESLSCNKKMLYDEEI